jgi:hypothetical protein
MTAVVDTLSFSVRRRHDRGMFSMADKIMLIRHAEKPDDLPPDFGVDEAGRQNPDELVVRGWQRAGALACLFSPRMAQCRDPALATPRAIYASAAVQHSRSLRPQHTVEPLAAWLRITPNVSFAVGGEAELAGAATGAPGAVLIAWHHEKIPAIANAIIGNGTTCPQHWPGERYDMIWVFDRNAEHGAWHFSQVPQSLLAGDRATPIGPSS